MTAKEYEEIRRDECEAAYEDERIHYMLTNDEEYFWEYFIDEIEEAQLAIRTVKERFEAYGYEWDIRVLEE